MSYRFVVCVDVEAETLADAYSTVYDALTALTDFNAALNWESTDEVYDPTGEEVDEDEVQKARMHKMHKLGGMK